MKNKKIFNFLLIVTFVILAGCGSEQLNTETEETNTRLIDWGLSVYLKGANKNNRNNRHIPDNLNRRPFQFNVPFSVILFNKKFLEDRAYLFFALIVLQAIILVLYFFSINLLTRYNC